MILVDSSVWIDHFRGIETAQVLLLRDSLREGVVLLGDLMMAEVLQGCDSDRDFALISDDFAELDRLEIASFAVASEAARNFRKLRALGVTVRKTIDTLIATRCIRDDIALLYADRDFDAFAMHLGLRNAMTTGR